MKRKVMFVILASALEFYAAALTHAQTAPRICGLSGTANGATPVVTGPLNPVDGFPEWLKDSNGVSVQRCLDPAYCFFDPIIATDPFSVQIGSGGESFYWQAAAKISAASGLKLLVDMAAEAAFLSANPVTGAPVNGSQNPFLRFRIFFTPVQPGIYTIIYPYGSETFTVEVADGTRQYSKTVDAGFGPNATVTGNLVAPFLRAVTPPADPRFLGNMNAQAGLPQPVTGSPCTDASGAPVNYVKIIGKALDGINDLDLGGGANFLTTDLFDVQGMLYDGRTQTPLSVTRQTYTRPASGNGQVDLFARSTPTGVIDAANSNTTLNPPGTWLMPAPVTLSSSQLQSGGTLAFASIPVTDATTALRMPGTVTLSATDTTTDRTTLISPLVDLVTISTADYDPATRQLTVVAASGDQINKPTLTLRNYGTLTATPITTDAPPGQVTVISNSGGSDTRLVRVVTAAPPAAATNLAAAVITSGSITLTWSDNSNNESGFDIYRNAVKVGSVGANVTTYTDASLAPATAYVYQVRAFNNAGATASANFSASTKTVLPAPGTPAPSLSPVGSTRAINLQWADNSTDETGFHVERALAGTQVFTRLTAVPLAANVTTYADATAAVSSSYVYRVIGLRSTESSASTASTAITTPALPAAPAAPAASASANGLSVTLTWSASANQTAVERRIGTAAFTAASSYLAAGTTTFTDTTTAGTTYGYRLIAVNWAGSSASAETTVTTAASGSLPAPTNLRFPNILQANLAWTDNAVGETGYRVRRYPVAVNATTGALARGAVNLTATAASNATAYNDAAAAAGQTYIYDVAAMSGTTAGALALSPYIVPGGIGTPTSFSAAQDARNLRVTVQWRLPTAGFAAIGGTRIERCVVGGGCVPLGTASAADGTTWSVAGRPARAGTTLSFTDTGVARNVSYSYRITPVGGAGSRLAGATATTTAITIR